MGLRADRAALLEQAKGLSEQASKLSVQEYELQQQADALAVQIVMEEKILSRAEWVFEASTKPYLAAADGREAILGPLRALVFDSWHCGVALEEGVTIRHDDGEVTLHFDDPTRMKTFAEKQGLKVDFSSVKDLRDKLQARVDALSTWIG